MYKIYIETGRMGQALSSRVLPGFSSHFKFVQKMLNAYRIFGGTIAFDPSRKAYCKMLPFHLPRVGQVCDRMAKYRTNPSTCLHRLVARALGVFYSRHGGRVLCSDWTVDDRALLECLYREVLVLINKSNMISSDLHGVSCNYFGRIYALKYDGAGSEFGWHYDSLGPREYRAIFTVKQCGRKRVSFAYMDEQKNLTTLRPRPGEGVLIRSGETFHAVVEDNAVPPPDNSDVIQRWVLIFTYTTTEADKTEFVGAIDRYYRHRY